MLDDRVWNHRIATYFRSLRQRWNVTRNTVRAEPLRVIRGQQPDILVAEPYTDPVALETEFEPASTVEHALTRGWVAFNLDTLHMMDACMTRRPREDAMGWGRNRNAGPSQAPLCETVGNRQILKSAEFDI